MELKRFYRVWACVLYGFVMGFRASAYRILLGFYRVRDLRIPCSVLTSLRKAFSGVPTKVLEAIWG